MKKANKAQMTTTERYINPFTDFGFKKIFGTEANKEQLISFLNGVLPLESPIATLQYKKTEHLGYTDADRKVIYDLYCESEKGEKFIVELQKTWQAFFKDRTVFYATFPIQEQAQRGDWDFRLQPVYTVALLNFRFDEANKTDVKHLVKLMDVDKKEVFYDKMTFLFIQMPNFNKKEEELETMEDKWLYVLKNLSSFSDRPVAVQERIFDRIFQVAEIAKFTPEERMAYEGSLKHYRDLRNSLNSAKVKGKQEAMEELMPLVEEARRREEEARRREEEAQKREKHLRQNLLTAAQALLAKGFSVEEVANMSGLSVKEIEEMGE